MFSDLNWLKQCCLASCYFNVGNFIPIGPITLIVERMSALLVTKSYLFFSISLCDIEKSCVTFNPEKKCQTVVPPPLFWFGKGKETEESTNKRS